MAGERLMSISQNEAERAWYRSRRKFETDMMSNMTTARDNGIAIGERSHAIKIARTALEMQMPIDDIVHLTGLTREEVARL